MAPMALACLALLGGIPLRERGASQEEPEFSVRAPLASRSLLLDGASAGGRLVVVGERGHILVSDDQGRSWRQTSVPTRATLTAVFFHDASLGWAVGHDAIILRTKDGGENWERVHYAPEEERPFLDVWFGDAANGVAIGAYGLFVETADGGDTWSPREIEGTDLHLNHIARSDAGRLYIVGEAGAIYRSDDDGDTWTALPSPYRGSFFGALPLRSDSLLVFGLRGHLFRSDDGARNWMAIETGTEAMLTDGLRLADGTLLIAGLGGTLLVSRDEGRSFTLRRQASREGIASVVQADDGTVVAIGELGVKALSPSEYTWVEKP
jgi:photosystem II stability/assembly factor-like uncharacterized protein